MIRKGPAGWRIFLFNIFDHAPALLNDFTWPEEFAASFVKKYPMLFCGGAGSITHMHFDIDLSNIFHTQFIGRKRVLLFPFSEQHKLYRKPFEVLSLADFSNYHQDENSPDYSRFPALKQAKGFEVILEHGETLYMPSGYWHHMEYLESGFAMSLRALQPSVAGKLKGAWNLFGMRTIDTVMKRTVPKWWYENKVKRIYANARKELLQ
jgi:ribosomal protein L16 Arg81 hydroxylase